MKTAAPLRRLVRQLRQAVEQEPFERLSDADLLERVRAHGDADAFAAIVRRHGSCVLAACRKVLSSEADIEDTFQATFLVLWRTPGALRRGSSLRSWLYSVAHRTALKARTAALRRQRAEQRQQAATVEMQDVSWREACAILHEELDQLPDTYRLPLLLCYLDGKSRDEAAQQLGVTTDALRGRLERGRERLRIRLTKRGIALSAGLLALVTASVTKGGPADSLLRATLEAAVSGRIPTSVTALLHGATPSATVGKCKLLAVAALVIGLLSGGVGLSMHGAPPATEPTPAPPVRAATVRERETQDRSRTVAALKEDDKPVAVSGKVIGPDGKPVAGAKVYFDPKQAAATTRDDGTFKLTVPADAPRVHIPGSDERTGVVLVAHADGYGPDWVTAALDDNDVTLRLVNDDVPIEGRLLDLEGKPAAGIRVEINRVSTPVEDDLLDALKAWVERSAFPPRQPPPLRELPAAFTALFASAVTDSKGNFRLTGVGRDRLVGCTLRGATIEQATLLTVTRPRFVLPEEGKPSRKVYAATFEHLVLPGRTLSGVVKERGTGQPLAGITVRDQKTGAETKTDDQGRYELRGVPKQSKFPVYAVPPGGSTWFTTSLVVADQPGLGPLRADFELQRGIAFRGTVTDKDGKPVAARVLYHPVYPNPHVATAPGGDSLYGFETVWARTRADGSFTVALLPGPGAVLIAPDRPGFQSALVEPRKFFKADEKRGYDYGDRDNLTIQLSGGASTRLSQEDYAAIVLVNPAKDAGAISQNITLEPAKPITGEVCDPDGQPLQGVSVRGLTGNGGGWQTQPSSAFTITNWNPGRPRRVEFWHGERKLVGYVELRADTKPPVRVQLQASAAVTGRIVNEDGKPWAGVMVFYSSSAPGGSVTVDREGRFRIDGLIPALEYTLNGRTTHPPLAHAVVASKLVLRPGETKDLGDMRLKKDE